MHHADIPLNLDYNSYKLQRTDSTLFFNTRLLLRKSHRDLFSVASNTWFFFFKYVNQPARCIKGIKVSFKPIEIFCKMTRTNDSNRQNMLLVELFIETLQKKNCPNQLLWYINFKTKHETIFLQCQPLLHR